MASPELTPAEGPNQQKNENNSANSASADGAAKLAPVPSPSIFESRLPPEEPSDSELPGSIADNAVSGIHLPPPSPPTGSHELFELPPPEAAASPLESVLKREMAQPSQADTKIGLLGGSGVGKTYFFFGMIYRTWDEEKSGAVSYYLHSSKLRRYERQIRNSIKDSAREFDDLSPEIERYERWEPFAPTPFESQLWYRLRLGFKTGLLGRNQSHLDLEFLDGSGEGFTRPLGPLTTPIWEGAFRNAGIMIFCLPIWAAFPAAGLSAEDQEMRDNYLSEFQRVVNNYSDIRAPNLKVRSILALTMADDKKRCALEPMIESWIEPYMEDPETYLAQLRRRSGIPRYLASAQAVSGYLHQEFRALRSKPLVSKIPKQLDFGLGRPWIIPVSAVDGTTLEGVKERLDRMSKRANAQSEALLPGPLEPPIPIHVELPLLAALCENHNALM